MSISEQHLRTFLTELAAQIDGGRTPTPEGVAAAVGIDLEDARDACRCRMNTDPQVPSES